MTIAKSTERIFAQTLSTGAARHFASTEPLRFGGQTVLLADVLAMVASYVALRTAVDEARTALQTSLVASAAGSPALRQRIAAFEAFVRAAFGNAPEVLADFGLKPKKARTPLTLEQRAAAVERSAATRAARHTLGKKQKRRVRGTVTTIVVTPPGSSP